MENSEYTTRTNKEWIVLLPDDVKEKVWQNTLDDYREGFNIFLSRQNTFKCFTKQCFTWSHTPEGYDYWAKTWEELKTTFCGFVQVGIKARKYQPTTKLK